MRKWSRKFINVNGEKHYLVSVKAEWGGWSPVAFFKKSKQKDEFGLLPDGDSLQCPHPGEIPAFAWTPLPDYWLGVNSLCKRCWGSHCQPDGYFNCVLRNLMITQYDNRGNTNHD